MSFFMPPCEMPNAEASQVVINVGLPPFRRLPALVPISTSVMCILVAR
jgi:hypothetical protein